MPDWRRLRVHLKETYGVGEALYFLGYMVQNEGLYRHLRESGYSLVFKKVSYTDGVAKGNVDAEVVLHAMIQYPNYEKAVLLASDGDYTCLVEHLKENGKLERVVSPHRERCSGFLMEAAGDKMDFLEDVRHKIRRK